MTEIVVTSRPAARVRDANTRGVVFDLHRSALHDGPGIRTTVFLKGCPLRCTWCHNPESQAFEPELSFNRSPTADLNAPGAVELIGRKMSVGEVMDIVMRDVDYYERSGGGLTISGGEPMAQFGFTRALLREARRRNIHTVLDTCGQARTSYFEAIINYVDLFLYDLKDIRPDRHAQNTGVTNRLILHNLDMLYERGAPIILRCPLIPGVNDSPDHLEAIATICDRYMDLQGIEIMPYHNMGQHKAEKIGRDARLKDLDSASEEQKQQWLDALAKLGCTRVRLG